MVTITWAVIRQASKPRLCPLTAHDISHDLLPQKGKDSIVKVRAITTNAITRTHHAHNVLAQAKRI